MVLKKGENRMAHRPNILKLATKISLESLTYTGITYNDPEYRILEPIIDDDMCQIMMHMRLEANRTRRTSQSARRRPSNSRRSSWTSCVSPAPCVSASATA